MNDLLFRNKEREARARDIRELNITALGERNMMFEAKSHLVYGKKTFDPFFFVANLAVRQHNKQYFIIMPSFGR
jgi:hypothetical protein